ncbi:MAG: hypothetical protein PHY10_01480 [Patescibacteria group bacterium]|nr:hypothetical protein [Patescibacteria group bacterium]
MAVFVVIAGAMIAWAWPIVTQPNAGDEKPQSAITHFRNVLNTTANNSLTLVQLKDTMTRLGQLPMARQLGWSGYHLDSLLSNYAKNLAVNYGDTIKAVLGELTAGKTDTATFCEVLQAFSTRIAYLRVELSIACPAMTMLPDDSLYPYSQVWDVWEKTRTTWVQRFFRTLSLGPRISAALIFS